LTKTVQQYLQESIELPINHSERYLRLGIKPHSGILLYGPSGCGKSLTVKALASMKQTNFISVTGVQIFSKYLGDTEKFIRNLFKKARQLEPCIIFFDEIDSIAAKRGIDEGTGGIYERALTQLLTEIEGIQDKKSVLIIGCTNRPDMIDDAMLRPGRFDQLFYVGPPDEQDRINIFSTLQKKI